MGYDSGMLDTKVVPLMPQKSGVANGEFGRDDVYENWVPQGEYWASVKFVRGLRAMRDGNMDAYDQLMVRMRWNSVVKRGYRLRINGVDYQIDSLNADKRDNVIQITCTEVESANPDRVIPSDDVSETIETI